MKEPNWEPSTPEKVIFFSLLGVMVLVAWVAIHFIVKYW